jgi:glycosyltransferase involved in cell wall biosynthesis
MKLSIIIPFYSNSIEVLKPCLNSIQAQKLDPEDFEIIIVDDCSPTICDKDIIMRFSQPNSNLNIRVIRLLENRRQGGARNEGILHANGDWIAFIDQDDYWEANVVERIFKSINCASQTPDMVMLDYSFHKGAKTIPRQYIKNTSKVYSGLDFIKNEELTWAPWGYFYRRNFLLENGLKFAEHVRLEDADFAIRCISHAKIIYFLPISLVHYSVTPSSTTNISNSSREVVNDLFLECCRMFDEYIRITAIDTEAGKIIKKHTLFSFKIDTYRFIWLKYRDINSLTNKYFKDKFKNEDGLYLHFISSYPTLYSRIVSIASPILRMIVRHKQKA